VLIAIETGDTTIGTAALRSIVLSGVLFAAARLTQARRAAATRSRDEATS
jgi:hypothetical protein